MRQFLEGETLATNTSPQADIRSATIPSNYTRLIAQALGLSMRSVPRLLDRTGISAEQFLDEDFLLTESQQIKALENALRIAEAGFGLRLGHQLTPASHGAIGFLAYSSASLRVAMDALRLFAPTRMSFVRIELIESWETIELQAHFDLEISQDVEQFLADTLATIFFELARSVLGRPLSEAKTLFKYAAPGYRSQYSLYLPGPVSFGAQQFTVQVPVAICDEPNISADHEHYALALRHCEAMSAQLHANASYRYQVQKMMLARPPGTLDEEATAAALFMSKRTLARKLQAEGTGFRHIRDEILAQQAASYLQETSLSVESIAALMNYHDSASFRRAFRRWFSCAPQDFSKRPANTNLM